MGIFDSIWRRRGRPSNNQEPIPDQAPEYLITGTDRDYSDLLERDDVAIKFWLPELMGTILDETCAFMSTSRSDLVRQTLFTYLYGRYDWLGMYERGEREFQLNPPTAPALFSMAPSSEESDEPDLIRDLGKNIEDLKVWIPSKMKEDIQALAQQSNISNSEMIREILISTLIGHTYLSTRKDLLQMEIEFEDQPHE